MFHRLGVQTSGLGWGDSGRQDRMNLATACGVCFTTPGTESHYILSYSGAPILSVAPEEFTALNGPHNPW